MTTNSQLTTDRQKPSPSPGCNGGKEGFGTADALWISSRVNAWSAYWLRFDKQEALASFDGLYVRCNGNPENPRWLGRRLVSGGDPRQ